jgi:hypothetical protein
VPHASNPAIQARGLNGNRDARTRERTAAVRARRNKEISLDPYLRRLDPEVAASFSDAQREALKDMLGARGVAKHTVEVRRSIPLGRRRFYLVFLLGPEGRGMSRLYSQGAISGRFTLLFYLGLGAIFLAPVLALLATTAT